ncbi:MAG: hypothetical protein N4A33_06145 [Bacteriovoracaceae bacterium]|nr:hypothetical protein [Bacteriovoracaceae bacterium]
MKKITKNQKGQGVLEYVILTALIGIFCLVSVKKIGGSLNGELKKINTKIDGIVESR